MSQTRQCIGCGNPVPFLQVIKRSDKPGGWCRACCEHDGVRLLSPTLEETP